MVIANFIGRIVPLTTSTSILIEQYVTALNLIEATMDGYPLFHNGSLVELKPLAIKYIVNKYIEMAKIHHPELFPEEVSIHSLRFSKIMHLLQDGGDLEYISDFLGHTDIKSAEVYENLYKQIL